MRITSSGIESPIVKHLRPEEIESMRKSLPGEVSEGDLIFFASDKTEKAQAILGTIRLRLANLLKLIPKREFAFVWVDEFPLFQYNEDTKQWEKTK